MNAREVIAHSTGMCEYAMRRATPHDHQKCLEEADQVLQALAYAGLQVVGVAVLDPAEGIS